MGGTDQPDGDGRNVLATAIQPHQLVGAPSVGLLSIGQSPRPDLTAPFRRLAPHVSFMEAGALDHLSESALPPAQGAYPLVTRLRNGNRVVIDEAFLAPHLQAAVNETIKRGVKVVALLCAGSFDALHCDVPLLKPFALAQAALRTMGLTTIDVISPFAQQEEPIRRRWQAAGFQARVSTAHLADDVERIVDFVGAGSGRCVVLDYVGHASEAVAQLRGRLPVPLLDLGEFTMLQLVTLMNGRSESSS